MFSVNINRVLIGIFVVLLAFSSCALSDGARRATGNVSLEPRELRCESLVNPQGLDAPKPRMSWKLVANDPTARGLAQSAYQILVASRAELLAADGGDLWDSGRVESNATNQIHYGGTELVSNGRCSWKVRVWDERGRLSAWSTPASWTMGLLVPSDWHAQWIGSSVPPVADPFLGARWIWSADVQTGGEAPVSTRWFSKTVAVQGNVLNRVHVRISADNSFQLFVNHRLVASGNDWRVPADVDIAGELHDGDNEVAIQVTNGGEGPNPAGLLAVVEQKSPNETEIRTPSDATWRVSPTLELPAADDPSAWSAAVEIIDPPEAWQTVRSVLSSPDPWLRKSFELEREPLRAVAYVASIGYHECYVDGERIGDAVLAPNISDLEKRARYVTYDLSGKLHRGRNALGLWLGSGWSSAKRFGIEQGPLATAQLELCFADGSIERIVTDASWKTKPSSITHGTPWAMWAFGGDRLDGGAELADWSRADFDDSAWPSARVLQSKVVISAEALEPNRIMQVLPAAKIEVLGPDAWRVDFGRNFTGWVELPLSGKPGSTVTVGVSEHIEDDASFNQSTQVVLPASGETRYRQRFNYTAGRWSTVRGSTPPTDSGLVRGLLIHNDYDTLGEFKCSNELLNRIHDTVVWTYRCLSLGGYTVDCPHRERMGYGGDAHASMKTALTHFGLEAFYSKWLEDWRDVQYDNGDLPYTAPTFEGGGGPAWSGIVIALPWELYVRYGNLEILTRMFPTMQRWLAFLETKAKDDGLQPYGHPNWGFLGDWVPPGRDQGGNRIDQRSTFYFNDCYWLASLEKVARIAELLGKSADAASYRARAGQIRRAINTKYFDAASCTFANGEQPYLAIALLDDVSPKELRPRLLENLEHEIRVTNQGHVNSGIHGTYFLLEALMRERRNDLIFELATKTDYPSWGNMLEHGATTMWEQWDGDNSLMHSSFLSIGAWFVEGLAGIRADPEHPGYEHFFVEPALVGDLTWAAASFRSIRGLIESHWSLEGGECLLEVSVPPNTTATIVVPTNDAKRVTESGAAVTRARGVIDSHPEVNALVCRVSSGQYSFRSPWRTGTGSAR